MKLTQLHKSLWFWVILVHIIIFFGFYDLIKKGLSSGIDEDYEPEQKIENNEQRTMNNEQ